MMQTTGSCGDLFVVVLVTELCWIRMENIDVVFDQQAKKI